MARRSAVIVATTISLMALSTAMVVTPIALADTAKNSDLATAAPAPAAKDPAMVAELARTFNISLDQAVARLDREAGFARAEVTLRSLLGKDFGGAYLNGDASTLTVAITDPAHAARVRAAGALSTVVTRSEAQLKSLTAQLDQTAKLAPKQTPGWYADVRTNAVVVLVRTGGLGAAKAWVKASGVEESAVRFEASTEDPRPMIDVIGGNAYFIGGGTRCSIGFAVSGGFVTAGHCGGSGATTSQPTGTVAGSSFPGNDYGWVRVAAGNTPRPLVNRYPGTVPVNGSQASGVGSSVCRSGSTTGWRCGTINQLNASVTYPQGTVTGLVRTNVCAEPGDSGGSWLTGDQAQGVTSGGSGNCTSGGVIYYQPVNEILQVYGLTLTVGGTPPPTTPPPTPTASPTGPPPPGCGGLVAWSASTSYSPGNLVSHSGRRYESTWWSTGSEPGAPQSWAVWKDQGAC